MRLHDLRQIHDSYRHIYLSPHFDDAALSCGGAIMRQLTRGEGVLVVTICSGSPAPDAPLNRLAQEFHASWKLPQQKVVDTRRAEDAAAMDSLGVDYFYLDLLDAIYRHLGYDRRELLFSGALLPDDPLPGQLAGILHILYDRAPHATIYSPLAIGGHVDHQATFETCWELARQDRPIAFYEDIPYVLVEGSGEQRLRQIPSSLELESIEISRWLRGKLAAIEAYDSQLGELFGGAAAMREAVAAYAQAVRPEGGEHGERLWRYTKP